MKAKTDAIEYLETQYAFEVEFHQKILAEPDPKKRRELSKSAYAYAYGQSKAVSPDEMDFGFQSAELTILAPMLPDKQVVDYGCGYGSSTLAIARYAQGVIGCDILPEVVVQAEARVSSGQDNIRFRLVEPGDFPFAEQSVDLVYASDVIEHLHPEDALAFVRQVYAALKPGGKFVCITPHACYGPSDISSHFLPPGSVSAGFHLKEYTYAGLQALFMAGGFQNALTPLLSPRHLAKIPFYQTFWRLFWNNPSFRVSCEHTPWLMNSFWLRKIAGLNRSVYLIGTK